MSTNDHKTSINSKLENLRLGFFNGLPERLRKIEQTGQQLLGDLDTEGQLESLIIALHSLAGTSATYGYLDISKHAKAAERFLREQDPLQLDSAAVLNKLSSYTNAILLDIEENNFEQLAIQRGQELTAQIDINRGSGKIRIYVADDDPVFLQELSVLLTNTGYMVSAYANLAELEQALLAHTPHLLITDILFSASSSDGIDFIQRMQQQHGLNIPVIFLSVENTLPLRYRAQQVGGYYYLHKPVDFSELIHSIELVVSQSFAEPSRVLIIDDDPEHATYTAHILQQNGIDTEISLNPETALDAIEQFQPEVILLDMFMPRYNGLELARMMRMDPRQQFTSLLFLSAETDLHKHLEALALGADDFLVKPVNPHVLLQTVQIRAHRTRAFAKAFAELGHVVNELEHFKMALDDHAIVSVADAQGIITYANQKFCDITGYSHAELRGQSHSLLNSGHHPRSFFTEMWKTIASGHTWQGEIKNRTKSGDYYWVASTITPLIGANGRPEQYISIRTDISTQKRISESLRLSEERLRRSQEAAKIGNWDWNIHTGELYWSEQIAPLFGYSDVVETTYENFIGAVHPEDRELVANSVNACVQHGAVYDIEHRIVRSDGQVRWLSEKGDVFRGEDGKAEKMIGVVQDITRRKSAERLLDLLNDSTSYAISSEEFTQVFERMLRGLLDLTDSEYGFIGEVLYDKQGQPYLKTHSITNISWNEESRKFYSASAPEGMEFHNLDTLFGHVLISGQSVISNDPANDPRAGGLPAGHPPLHAFLGIPLYSGQRIIGMYGIANRPEGYDDEVIEFLKPFNATCSSLIHALWISRERIKDHEELRHAKELAESASRSKTDFLSRMSHELRTPLNAILGFGQLMESDDADPLSASHQTSVEQILTAGWHLLELINEVLDLSKIEAGKLSISMEAIDANEVIDECLRLTEQMLAQYQVTIDNQLPDKPLFVHADRIRFKQIYLNLLTNAIKYNRRGGTVTLAYSIATTDEVQLSITDTGYGIPEQRLPELFEPFNRLGAENSTTEGTGIGLVIAKRMTELMHGQLDVVSTVDVGSTFLLTLALDDNLPDAMVYHDTQPEVSLPALTSAAEYRVLYVEDNPANQKLVGNIIKRLPNVNLITESDGEAGLKLAMDIIPDLILLDINLPGMSGIEICSILNNNPATRKIPRIAISANAMPSDIEAAMLAGFNDYLTKPIDVKNFLTTISKYKNKTG